jgi:hypothetical protein
MNHIEPTPKTNPKQPKKSFQKFLNSSLIASIRQTNTPPKQTHHIQRPIFVQSTGPIVSAVQIVISKRLMNNLKKQKETRKVN